MTLTDIDLRDRLAQDVHNQGERPLCVAFAMSLAHEAARSTSGQAAESLAPEPLWSWAHSRGFASEKGTSVFAVANALSDTGQPELDLWPYNSTLGSGTEVHPPATGEPPWYRAEVDHFDLARDSVEAELEECLADGRVALIVVEVTDDFWNAPTSGVISTDLGARSLGRHAIAVVGAATVASTRSFLIQNSWGAGWGAGGYAWLTHAYLSAFGAEASTVVG